MHNEKIDKQTTVAPGFRLERLELWNWGTFNGAVQVLEPTGGWALLVGDNGSGKSTAIDALRTLLVPPRLLNYNDASGDGRRSTTHDRTRRSYVRGAWASSSTLDETKPTIQYLREAGVLSAIGALFSDKPRQTSVTLVQILWEAEEQIHELYALAPQRRGLADLVDGHVNTTEIRRAARRQGWQIEDSFAAYAERLRGLLHIPGDKALEVFNRAMGMKEVTDIDAFVRQFMMPSAETFAFIRDTVQPHYRTLLDCWAAIERAERQISLLRPVAEQAVIIGEAEARIENWKRLQSLVEPYVATKHLGVLRENEVEFASALRAKEAQHTAIDDELAGHQRRRDDLNAAIATTDVGPRLQTIQAQQAIAKENLRQTQLRRARVEPAAALLGMTDSLGDPSRFSAARAVWENRERVEIDAVMDAEERRATHHHRQSLALVERNEKQAELESVQHNRVNIPRSFLAIRVRVCQAVGVEPETIPFAGELIEVRNEYSDWTGAIERLLRGFGLSLLVPEASYRRAASFINANWLGLRLDFHLVPSRPVVPPNLTNDRVPGRLEFKTDHPHHLWLAAELMRRFSHRCCASVAELETTDKGLTREGLVRNGSRHTKDDARPVDDPGQRILGWSTAAKLLALRNQVELAEQLATNEGRTVREAQQEADAARKRHNAAHDLLTIDDYSAIDVRRWSEEVVQLQAEYELLDQNSAPLRALRHQLEEVELKIRGLNAKRSECDKEEGRWQVRLQECRDRILAREKQLSPFIDYNHDVAEKDFAEIPGLPVFAADGVDNLSTKIIQSLQGRSSHDQQKATAANTAMVRDMGQFLAQFPEFGQTLQVGREYAESFSGLLKRIEEEDLPRHRERFEQYLNENLVGDLLMLNRRLEEHTEAIVGRIEEINQALREIKYGDETYVELRLVNRPGHDVEEFRSSLRRCFEHGIAPRAEERLEIFQRVRLLLEALKSDPEKTKRITDVRTWLSSGARELRKADNSEVDYLTATTGKSGGQKTRLAFTILASALAAQYGLSAAADDSPNFRLVVIDEAFSRTDELNSTRAMELFSRLGFQLLIVGPFDAKAKLAVPFVETIHLASNPEGNNSRLMAITREQVESQPPEVVTTDEKSLPVPQARA
jgi:uncharacterized protein YPO0396